MPNAGRLDLEGPVSSRLVRLKYVLLPDEIAKDPNASWVLEHDALRKSQTNYPWFEEDFYYADGGGRGWSRFVAGYVTAGLLQSKMPFYFASLFHIGRQIKVMEAALSDCQVILNQEDNLRASAINVVSATRSRSRRAESSVKIRELLDAEEAIRRLCFEAIARHEAVITKSRVWWRSWQSEISLIRRQVGEIEEAASFGDDYDMRKRVPRWLSPVMGLMLLTSRQSPLQSSMVADGVRFKHETPNPQSLAFSAPGAFLTSMLHLFLLQGGGDFDRDYFRHYYYDFLEEQRRSKRDQNMERAVARLENKYGVQTPFRRYAVGGDAADGNLIDLIRECQIRTPETVNTPWLNEWRDALARVPPGLPTFRKAGVSLGPAILLADRAIKLGLVRSQTVSIQELFEVEWVERYGNMTARAEWDLVDFIPVSSFHDFALFQTQVAHGLNLKGYRLEPPTTDHLRTVYDRCVSDERLVQRVTSAAFPQCDENVIINFEWSATGFSGSWVLAGGFSMTWRRIFAMIAPGIIRPKWLSDAVKPLENAMRCIFNDPGVEHVRVTDETRNLMMVRLLKLGLIEVDGGKEMFKLTPEGLNLVSA